MKGLGVFLLLFTTTAIAREPPYTYQQFGYVPPDYDLKALSQERKSELDSCVKLAKETEEASKKSADKMSVVYGRQALQYDYFGVYLTACLADEKAGKGWTVLERQSGTWKNSASRFATRTFMKLTTTE